MSLLGRLLTLPGTGRALLFDAADGPPPPGGEVLGVTVTFIPGTARGGARAPGASLLGVGSLTPGRARVYVPPPAEPTVAAPLTAPEPVRVPARAGGASLGARAVFIPGTARGSARAAGAVLTAPWLHYYAPRWTDEQRARIAEEDARLLESLLWN
jgi:hypothetical protein